MNIGARLYRGFGWTVGLLLLLSLVNVFAIFGERSSRDHTSKLFELQQNTSKINNLMGQTRQSLGSYLLGGTPDTLNSFNNGYGDLNKYIEAAIKLADDVGEKDVKQALDNLRSSERSWYSSFAQPLLDKRKQVDSGNTTAADLQVFYLTKFDEATSEKGDKGWELKSATALANTEAAIKKDVDTAQTSSRSTSTFVLFFSIFITFAAIGIGIYIAYTTHREITGPLQKLMAVAREIGDSGDLNQEVDISRTDEIGELARTFHNLVNYLKEMAAVSEAIAGGDLSVEIQTRSKRDLLAMAFSDMAGGLRQLVSSVRDNASQVSSGSNQVASASEESARINVQAATAIEEVTSTMHEMSINVQNMVKNTQTQASSVSETSASIDEMVVSIQRVADTAKVLLDISQRSREEVQSGIVTMDKATEGLNRINVAIGSSATIISDLGQKTEDIGKIIEVIDDLAEQTNLLALNAAIEAARAGEHGLGFAVVADEVRKLAEKSAQSTREISELIQGIQKEARKAVDNMEKSTSIVDEGLNLGNEMSTALKKISNVVTEVYKFAQEIGAATNEQSHGSSQIARATSRLNEITHEISSAVEEQSSGAQAVVRAMEKMRELTQRSTSGSTELAASAEQMSKMARTLLDHMDRFVLDANQGHALSGANARLQLEPRHSNRLSSGHRDRQEM